MISNIRFKVKILVMILSTYYFADQVMIAIENLRNPPTVDSTMMKTLDDVDLLL